MPNVPTRSVMGGPHTFCLVNHWTLGWTGMKMSTATIELLGNLDVIVIKPLCSQHLAHYYSHVSSNRHLVWNKCLPQINDPLADLLKLINTLAFNWGSTVCAFNNKSVLYKQCHFLPHYLLGIAEDEQSLKKYNEMYFLWFKKQLMA